MENTIEITYIVSQLFALASFIAIQTAYHLKTKKAIFGLSCVANVLDICHYAFLGAGAGSITKVLALIRNLFIAAKEDHKVFDKDVFMYIFAAAYVIAVILMFDGIVSLLPFAAALIYLLVTWGGDELAVKRIAFICYWLWLAYNIAVFSIVGVITTCVALVSTGIAYYNEHKRVAGEKNTGKADDEEK